ncbi:DUF5985 family protein [Massilia sp. SM-13]|uniref:DUF5985 family protein n=1 Tax=Pseudoduganella rhizocola TaxID=3382643 RepID=UPI0038B4851E
MNDLADVISGAIAALSLVAALFFLRFWRSSRDKFFLWFAISFGIEGLNRMAMAITRQANEDTPVHYVVRLVSYLLILYAIVEKNYFRRH